MPDIPRHAQRVYRITGKVPKPRYNVAVDNRWIGKYVPIGLEGFEGSMGRGFSPTEWSSKGRALRVAKRALVRDPSANVEVVEAFGSFPEDRKTVWRGPKTHRERKRESWTNQLGLVSTTGVLD